VRAAVAECAPELIFHLAAQGVDPRRRNPITIVQTNVVGLVHLLEALRGTAYRRLVNTGTCFECAGQRKGIAESAPLDPVNVYAASKTMALHVCTTEARLHGKSITTLRPFTFFGPGEQPRRLIPSVIAAVLAGRPIRITAGTQTRDYTYVEDMADAFVAAAVTPEAGGEVIHVGTGQTHPVREIARRVRDILGSDVPIEVGAVPTRTDDHSRLCADPAKARKLLGWRPKVTFEEGVRKTAEWLRH
jgi:nucleoside-diphosphate-sugar epimerase